MLDYTFLHFCREALWKAIYIATVIIDHIVVLHPCNVSVIQVYLSLRPFPIGRWRGIGRAGRGSWSPHTGFATEVSVGSSEWCLWPVRLDEPPSCCPIISMPEAYIDPRSLVFWSEKGLRLILVNSNDNVTDRPAERLAWSNAHNSHRLIC